MNISKWLDIGSFALLISATIGFVGSWFINETNFVVSCLIFGLIVYTSCIHRYLIRKAENERQAIIAQQEMWKQIAKWKQDNINANDFWKDSKNNA